MSSVPAGFPKTLTFSVLNTSCVPLTFSLRVLGDGLGPPSVSYEDHLSDMSSSHRQVVAAEDKPGRPAEFSIRPSSGCVSPQSQELLQVESVSHSQLDLCSWFPQLKLSHRQSSGSHPDSLKSTSH